MNSLSQDINNALEAAPKNISFGLAVIDDAGNQLAGVHPDVRFQALSLNKLPVAYALGQSGLNLGKDLQLDDKHRRGGDGILKLFPNGYELTLGKAADLMLSISDNTATAMVVEELGGPLGVNERLDSDSWTKHLPISRLEPVDPNNSSPHARYYYGLTTAREAAIFMQAVGKHPAFGEALRRSNYDYGPRDLIDRVRRQTVPASNVLCAAQAAHTQNRHVADALYRTLLDTEWQRSEFPVKAGVDEEFRHAAFTAGRLTCAVLSEGWPANLPEDATHPVQPIYAQIGSIVYNAGR